METRPLSVFLALFLVASEFRFVKFVLVFLVQIFVF